MSAPPPISSPDEAPHEGSDEKIVSSDDPSAVLPEKKTAYISQIIAPLTVLTVSMSYKQSRRKHSKVPARPMNGSTTGKIDQIRRHARPPKVCLTAKGAAARIGRTAGLGNDPERTSWKADYRKLDA